MVSDTGFHGLIREASQGVTTPGYGKQSKLTRRSNAQSHVGALHQKGHGEVLSRSETETDSPR